MVGVVEQKKEWPDFPGGSHVGGEATNYPNGSHKGGLTEQR